MALSRFVRRPRREVPRPSLVGISAPQLRFESLEDRITPVFTPDPLFVAGTLPATGAGTNLNGAPLNIVAGDFNGDGRMDFAGAAATAAKSAPRIDVYLSDAGTGNTYTPLAIFPGGTRAFGNPVGLAAVDVTADGKAELVSIYPSTGEYLVSRLENTGVFVTLDSDLVDPDKSKVPFAPNTGLGGVTGGDFNGDGKGDFVVTLTGSPNGNQYSVFLNTGNGKSFVELGTPLKTGIATNFTEPISADFDVDGNLDFAMINRTAGGTGVVTVMFGNGAGGFTFARNLNVASAPNAITAGDFDKNGKVDIAVGLQNGSVTLFLKDPTSNTFTTKANAVKFANPIVSLAAADYNIDGFGDLAIVTSDGPFPAPTGEQNVDVYLGSADVLTTAMAVALGSPFGPLVGIGGSVVAVDLDANGNLDFVTGEGSSSGQIYTPYFNQSGVGGETFLFQDRTTAEFGEVINYDVTIFPPPDGGPLPTGDVQFFDVMTDSTGAQTFVFLGTDDLEAGLDNQGSSISVADFDTSQLAMPLTVGPHTIVAKYVGDANYPAKSSNTTAINVTKADTTATVTPSVATPVFGQSVELFVRVTTMTGLIPGGQVDFFDNGNAIGSAQLDAAGKASLVVNNFTIGDHAIQGRYAGAPNFQVDSSAGVIVAVSKANSVTVVSANATTGIFGDTITFTADVDIAAPGKGAATGTVEFFDGTTKVAVGALNATGIAVVNVPGLTVGSHPITARFVATASVAASASNVVTITIAPTTSVATLSANPTTNEVGTNVVLTAAVNDTMTPPRPVGVGTVTFTGVDANGATITVGPVAVVNGFATATIPNLPQGTSAFSATFSGTTSIAGDTTNAVQVFTDRATPAVVLFNNTGTTTTVLGKDVTFTVLYTPVNGLSAAVSGSVTFTDNGNNVLGTVPLVNGQASVTTRLSLGAHAVAAAYTGSGVYKPLATTQNFTVTRPIDPIAVGAGVGGTDIVRVYNPDGSIQQDPLFAFGPDHTSGARVATGDVNGDGVPDRIIGTGPGTAARVRVLDGVTSAPLFEVFPFDDFTGGVFVSAADVDGDLRADFVVTPDQGGGPRVTLFNGSNFTVMANFFGIDDPDFRGGARAALGDINGDAIGDLVVSAGFGGGPRVAAFDGRSVRLGLPVKLFNDFFAFEETLRNGAFPAVGDVDGDGFGDLVMGAGPGGGPRVTAFSGADLMRSGGSLQTQVANFFAGDQNQRGGVPIVTRTLDNDNRADIVTGSGPGGRRVNAYLGATIQPQGQPPVAQSFDAFGVDFNPLGGVFVG